MTTTETTTQIDAMRANIPAELQQLAQWVTWKYEQRPDEKKPTKVLYNPATGARADSTEPRTWATFTDASSAYERGGFDGLGFVVTDDDPYVGVDLDGCIVDGALTDNANRWLLLLNSYTEITPSLNGVRVWIRGKKPTDDSGESRCKSAKFGVEIYETERFFTVTGNVLSTDLPTTINERQSELEALYNEVFPAEDEDDDHTHYTASVAVLSMDDRDLVERMCRKPGVQALWDGDTSGHNNDDSGADQALCNHLAYYTNCDPARIDRLFRQSGLYRPKWERKDYRGRTIAKAIAGCRGSYDPENYRSGDAPLKTGTHAIWRNGSYDEPVVITGVMGKRDGELYYTIEGSRAGIPASQIFVNGATPTGAGNAQATTRKRGIFQLRDDMLQAAKALCIAKGADFVAECAERDQSGDAHFLTCVLRGNVTYDHASETYYFWNNIYWEPDPGGNIHQIASDLLTTTYNQISVERYAEYIKLQAAAGDEPDESTVKRLKQLKRHAGATARRAKELYRHGAVDSVLKFARSTMNLGMTGDCWDANPRYLATQSHIIHLVTGQPVTPDPSLYIRTVSPVEYDPVAQCPTFLRMITEIFDSNVEKIGYIQRKLGYALSGECTESDFYVWYGKHGRNGKEAILEVIRAAVGERLAGVVNPDLLLKSNNQRGADSPTEAKMVLYGRRIAWASETEQGRQFDTAVMKDLSGGHIMHGRHNHGKQIEWRRSHTLFFLTNFLPHVNSQQLAEWDRIKLLEFPLSFVSEPDPSKPHERRKDSTLVNRIVNSELAGVLNWLITGQLEWRSSGLMTPDVVKSATARYKSDEDTLGHFIAQRCVTDKQRWADELADAGKLDSAQAELFPSRKPTNVQRVKDDHTKRPYAYECKPAELFAAYKMWMTDNGKPLGKHSFYKHIEDRGIVRVTEKGNEKFKGIGLNLQ